MDNKLFEIVEKIEKVELGLKQLKAYLDNKHIPANVSTAVKKSFEIEDLLFEVTDGLQDVEMAEVDFEGINLDRAFEGNPVSEYVTALTDYNLGDEGAIERIQESMDRITRATKEDEAFLILQDITAREEQIAVNLLKDLEEIERVLEGTEIDKWTHAQTELARYFLATQPDNNFREVDGLTPYGVGLAWKRRRYLGAAK